MMSAEDVLAVLDALAAEGISAWLDGGWAVEAVLGEQTREHKDLDLVVPLADVPRLQTILSNRGFRLSEGAPPTCFVMADEDGHQVDVHPVRWDEEGNGLYRMENGEDWVYPASGFAGTGSIFGQQVACLTPDIQMLCHAGGYKWHEKDFRDMGALHERFGVEYPPGFPPSSPAQP